MLRLKIFVVFGILLECIIPITDGCDSGTLLATTLSFPEHQFRGGIYVKQDQDFNDHPIYKHEDHDEFLFYIPSSSNNFKIGGYWVVGALPEGEDHEPDDEHDGFIVVSTANSPDEIKEDWFIRENENSSWVPEPTLRFICVTAHSHRCTDNKDITLQGLHARHRVHAKRMGVYSFTGHTYNLRPTYYHEDTKEFMFFTNSTWLIGPEIGILEGSIFVLDFALSPELISNSWVVFNKKYFAVDDGLTVECAVSGDSKNDLTQQEDRPMHASVTGNVTLHVGANNTLLDGNFTLTVDGSSLSIASLDTPEADSESSSYHNTTEASTDLPIDNGSECQCYNGGLCTHDKSGSASCLCRGGFSGKRCERAVTCGPPPATKNGEPILPPESDSKHTYNYLDVVMYVCHHGFTLNGENGAICDSNGHWSNPPRCKKGYFFMTGVPLAVGNTLHSQMGGRKLRNGPALHRRFARQRNFNFHI